MYKLPLCATILLPALNVLGHFANDKIDINVDEKFGGNNLFRETAEKYIDASDETIDSIDINDTGARMNQSSLPLDSEDYQNHLSDDHSEAYRRQKRATKDSSPSALEKNDRRRDRKGHRSSRRKDSGYSNEKDNLKPRPRESGRRRKYATRTIKKLLEIPRDLYQSHLRPGVVFRVQMTEALNKLMYRNYANDNDESVVEADIEYLRLTRKVLVDEITKFEDLKWLMEWNLNRTRLTVEHICGNHYYFMGSPPSTFSTLTEDMKSNCLFDGLYIDNVPYVIGDDGGIVAAVAPPVLHCDAGTCTGVPFMDSLMFESSLPPTHEQPATKCQTDCRNRCKNDPQCLSDCIDSCAFTIAENTDAPMPYANIPKPSINMNPGPHY